MHAEVLVDRFYVARVGSLSKEIYRCEEFNLWNISGLVNFNLPEWVYSEAGIQFAASARAELCVSGQMDFQMTSPRNTKTAMGMIS